MSKSIKKISVIGDGGWGTTAAIHLTKNGYNVTLWGPFPKYVARLNKNRYNSKFLPGIRIPKATQISSNLKETIESADLIVFAVPSKFASNVITQIKQTKVSLDDKAFLSLTKGLDEKTLKRISEIIQTTLNLKDVAVLSGPNIAMEIAKGVPSMAVIASPNLTLAKNIQTVFASDTFRIYTNKDIIGVELGGSIKNVMAIAAGVCDGLGYGVNTKAALLTRSLAEMSRFAKELGAKPSTFSGLSGLGDLITTSFSQGSRNRTVGEKFGKGKTLTQVMSGMEMVAEGVETVKSLKKLADKKNISMPITDEIYNLIYKNKSPKKCLDDLMKRDLKSE
jgi:glycerol-3-phosphate dehydrogenase (NAD(P)+)